MTARGPNHNFVRTATYRAWRNMLGSGIPVVPQWSDFRVFLADMKKKPRDDLVLTRKHIDKPHGPGNSKWRIRAKANYARALRGNKYGLRHGHCNSTGKSPTYQCWQRMFSKDRNADVDPRWLVFMNFLSDVGEKPPGKAYLMRRNFRQPFGPGNGYWASRKVGIPQVRKAYIHQKIIWEGKEQFLLDVLNEVNKDHELPVTVRLVNKRLKVGWTVYRSVMTEPEGRPYKARRKRSDGVKQETEATRDDNQDGGVLLLPCSEGRVREAGRRVPDSHPDVRTDGSSGESLHEEPDGEGARG